MDAMRRAARNTIGDAVARAAARFRDRTALRFGDRAWTFRELDDATSRIAAGLLAGSLRPGERAVAFGQNSDFYLLFWIACCKAGVVHVPANYALQAGELGYIAGQCGARLIVHDPALRDTAAAAGIYALQSFPSLLPAGPVRDDVPAGPVGDEVADEDIAQILYTSGTTGAPKGAMLTHRALLSEYASCVLACDYTATDRVLAALPLYHTAQMHTFAMPQLLAGAEIMLIERPIPVLCLKLIEQHRLTSFFAPPGQAPQAGLRGLPADRVEHHVHAPAIGFAPHSVHQRLGPVVEGNVRPQLAAQRGLVRPACGRDDAGTPVLRKLDRGRADAARAAIHQHRLTGLQRGTAAQGEVCGRVGNGQPGCIVDRHLLRQALGRAFGDGGIFGIAALVEQGAHPVADGKGAARASLGHPAHNLDAGGERHGRLHLVLPAEH